MVKYPVTYWIISWNMKPVEYWNVLLSSSPILNLTVFLLFHYWHILDTMGSSVINYCKFAVVCFVERIFKIMHLRWLFNIVLYTHLRFIYLPINFNCSISAYFVNVMHYINSYPQLCQKCRSLLFIGPLCMTVSWQSMRIHFAMCP